MPRPNFQIILDDDNGKPVKIITVFQAPFSKYEDISSYLTWLIEVFMKRHTAALMDMLLDDEVLGVMQTLVDLHPTKIQDLDSSTITDEHSRPAKEVDGMGFDVIEVRNHNPFLLCHILLSEGFDELGSKVWSPSRFSKLYGHNYQLPVGEFLRHNRLAIAKMQQEEAKEDQEIAKQIQAKKPLTKKQEKLLTRSITEVMLSSPITTVLPQPPKTSGVAQKVEVVEMT